MTTSRGEPWKTTDVQRLAYLAPRDALRVASELGRTPRAVQDKARRIGIPPPRMPHACYWTARTVRRARSLREQGMSVARISVATGVPVGTIKHWLYDDRRAAA